MKRRIEQFKLPLSVVRKPLKRYSKDQLKSYRHEAEQFNLPLSEPHKIVTCCQCGEVKNLEFRRSGDDELYYICGKCGFESMPMGEAPHWVK